MLKLLRLGAQLHSGHRFQPGFASRRADRPLELRGAQPMKKSPIHRRPAQHRQRSAIGIRQDRFAPKLRYNLLEMRGDLVEGFVPGNPVKISSVFAATSLRRNSTHRIKNPVRRIHPVEILHHLRTQKPARYRMVGVALNPRSAPILNRNQYPAGIRAIMRTGGMNHFLHDPLIIGPEKSCATNSAGTGSSGPYPCVSRRACTTSTIRLADCAPENRFCCRGGASKPSAAVSFISVNHASIASSTNPKPFSKP